jgi:multisubunit Na+/H+ antiporter MnhF subunit
MWMIGAAVMMGLSVAAGFVWRVVRGPRAGARLGALSRRWVMQHGEGREP